MTETEYELLIQAHGRLSTAFLMTERSAANMNRAYSSLQSVVG